MVIKIGETYPAGKLQYQPTSVYGNKVHFRVFDGAKFLRTEVKPYYEFLGEIIPPNRAEWSEEVPSSS